MTVPVGVVDVVVMLSVEVAVPPAGGVTCVGFNAQVVFAGQPVTTRFTMLLYPLSDVAVMVEDPPLPCVTVTEPGFEESEKSGTVTVRLTGVAL